MGLGNRYNGQDQEQNGQNAGSANEMNGQNDNQQNTGGSANNPYLSFEGGSFGLDLANTANGIGAKLLEILSSAKNKFSVKVFDREKYESQYSFITISLLNDEGDSCYYYALLLAETGPECLTAEQFVERISTENLQEEGIAGVYTLDVMLDQRTIDIIEAEIKSEFPKAELYEIGSSVVDGPIASKLLDVANHVAKQLVAAVVLERGEDLNLPYALKLESDGRRPADLKVGYRYVPEGTVRNGLGSAVKADFELKMTKNSKVRGFNVSNGNRELTTIYGYIDFMVEDVMERVGRDEVLKTKLIPHIIITDMVLNKYTTNFALLATVTGAIMTNKNMLVGHMLKNRDEIAAAIGVITVQDKKSGKAIEDLKKCSDEDFVAVINETVLMEPVLSLDIENNGASEFLAPFVQAAITGKNQNILDSAAVLTDIQAFSTANIAPFAHITKLPKIHYYKSTDRDGRDFTLQHILALSKDIDKAYDYNNVMNSQDAIVDGIEILSEFIPDGDVKGTILRVTINPEFLDELYKAVDESNITYIPLYIPDVRERRFSTDSSRMRTRGTGYFRAAGGNSRVRGSYDPYRRR